MTGCSAVNCTNQSGQFRLFRFPSDPVRSKKWLQNSRRGNWQPNTNSCLCEVHFEESQFEQHRADGWRKLKPDAVPTLFSVPNPPKRIQENRKSVYKIRKDRPTTSHDVAPTTLSSPPHLQDSPDDGFSFEQVQSPSGVFMDQPETLLLVFEHARLKKENEELKRELSRRMENELAQKAENEKLGRELATMKEKMSNFLNPEQQGVVMNGKALFQSWGHESVIKGLKFRFALGVDGYEYLRQTNYPLPSYSTLLRRVREFKVEFGIFGDLLEPLKNKVASMCPEDRFCAMSIDEMEIHPRLDFDKNKSKFYGKVTLGNPEEEGCHIIAVLIRGIKNPWKQVIAAEVTGRSTGTNHLEDLLKRCITYTEQSGLVVVSVTSDMGPSNQALWSQMGVRVAREGRRENSFLLDDSTKYVVPDVCHLLKNLKSAVLKGGIVVPDFVQDQDNLTSNVVDGNFIKQLWDAEMNAGAELRTLHHLNREDLFPDHFQTMNVGSAVRFFSIKTAAALETAIKLKILPKEALTTATFIRLIEKWFSLVSSRNRKTSVTQRNREEKFLFLRKVIETFQKVSIGGNAWKPLNRGFIMSTLSLIDIANFLLDNGFTFVMLSRFSQDALENVFSQVRRRAGKSPTALECLRAFKTVSLSQFISDVKHNSYTADSDFLLLDSLKPQKTGAQQQTHAVVDPPAPVLPHQQFPTINVSTIQSIKELTAYDLNLIYNVGGSTTRAVMKKCCDICKAILSSFPTEWVAFSHYKDSLNMGGLRDPSNNVLQLLVNCEILYRQHHEYLLRHTSHQLVDRILNEILIDFPPCCQLKRKIVQHFFTVRSFAVVGLNKNLKRRRGMYGTCSRKRSRNS